MTKRERFEKLRRLRLEEAAERGEPTFLGKPDAWFEAARPWSCVNGHSSTSYLRRDSGVGVCIGCGEPVVLLPYASDEALVAALEALGPIE